MDDLSDAQALALEQLRKYWSDPGALMPLPRAATLRLTKDEDAVGWRVVLPSDYLGKDRQMDIVLPTGFPEVAAQVWIDPNPFLVWPHAESNGKLCLWADGEAPVWLASRDAIDETIRQFRRIFKLVVAGSNSSDRAAEFAKEWLSYWRIASKPTTFLNGIVVSLTQPEQIVCPFHVIEMEALPGETPIFAASGSNANLEAWSANTGLAHKTVQENAGIYIRLTHAPCVPGAPDSLGDLIQCIEAHVHDHAAASERVVEFFQSNEETPLWIVFEQADRALAGLYLVPQLSKHVGQNRRSGHRPTRRRIGTKFSVVEVQRADASWVHGRGFDETAEELNKKHVIVVGTGSLGSMLAESLAMSGIGKMTLVDHAVLEFANVGRHSLGASDVGRSKSVALAERLRRDYPHLTIEPIKTPLIPTNSLMLGRLLEADLVVSTTANPATEQLLVRELKKPNIRRLQLCWTEPYALAGHSVVAHEQDTTLDSLFEEGEFVDPAIVWKGDTEFTLPGCGASHIPGAGNRIRMIASVVAEHAIDVLTDRAAAGQHRLWVADSETIEFHGGSRKRPNRDGRATILTEDPPMMCRS